MPMFASRRMFQFALLSMAAAAASCAAQNRAVHSAAGAAIRVDAKAVCRTVDERRGATTSGGVDAVPDAELCGEITGMVKDELGRAGFKVMDAEGPSEGLIAKVLVIQRQQLESGEPVRPRRRVQVSLQLTVESKGEQVEKVFTSGEITKAGTFSDYLRSAARQLAGELSSSASVEAASKT